MLRTLTPLVLLPHHKNESELVRLCHQRTWNAVVERCQSHPNEASPSEACFRGEGSTALSVAVRCGAPHTVVQALLVANVHQIAMTHRQRGSVLHDGLKHRCADDVLDLLLTAMVNYQAKSRTSTTCTAAPSATKNDHMVINGTHEQLLLTHHSTPPSATSTTHNKHHYHEFKHVSVQEQRFLHFPDLLGTVDDMNRTALHHLVERAKRLSSNHRRSEETFRLFQALVHSFPSAVQQHDADGYTPLVLLLLTPRGPVVGGKVETDIHRMVRFMLSVCPGASTRAKGSESPSLPIRTPIHRRNPYPSRAWKRRSSMPLTNDDRHYQRGSVKLHGQYASLEMAPLPLYYAILHGRSLETILLLLHDFRTHVGRSAGSLLVTHYHEVLLHVAVTTRAPLSTLYHLVTDCPTSVLCPDVYGLTCMDWLWIRHCLDGQQNTDSMRSLNRIMSRRRVLPTGFQEWCHRALQQLPHPPFRAAIVDASDDKDATSLMPSSSVVPVNPVAIRSLQEELLNRIKLFVPVAASVRANGMCKNGSHSLTVGTTNCQHLHDMNPHPNQQYPFSLLHAVCFVPCPIAFVQAALYLDHPATVDQSLRTPDVWMKRLPLHYAASRVSYVVHLPTGVTSKNLQVIHETSPVFRILEAFPQACRIVDGKGQLPLHVAIDTYKMKQLLQHRHRDATDADVMTTDDEENNDDDDRNEEMVLEGVKVLQTLLQYYPGALERRDGCTYLYPWQQAGVGSGSSTTLVYTLLRANPTVAFVTSTHSSS